jgi:hypothetical protein
MAEVRKNRSRKLERLKRRWKYNTFKETGRLDVSWIHDAEDRDQLRAFVNTVMKHMVP